MEWKEAERIMLEKYPNIKAISCTIYNDVFHFITMDKNEPYDPIGTTSQGGYSVNNNGDVFKWIGPTPEDEEWEDSLKGKHIQIIKSSNKKEYADNDEMINAFLKS